MGLGGVGARVPTVNSLAFFSSWALLKSIELSRLNAFPSRLQSSLSKFKGVFLGSTSHLRPSAYRPQLSALHLASSTLCLPLSTYRLLVLAFHSLPYIFHPPSLTLPQLFALHLASSTLHLPASVFHPPPTALGSPHSTSYLPPSASHPRLPPSAFHLSSTANSL